MMKSSSLQLINRGYLAEDDERLNAGLQLPDKLQLLKSKLPVERTLGARLLKNDLDQENVIACLVDALIAEKKLYPKIEISEALTAGRILSVSLLVKQLGKIGNNQHKTVPEKPFKKKSYPLPRDIVARILAHIGKPALPALLNVLTTDDHQVLSEAIDAVGSICFYDNQEDIFDILQGLYQQNSKSELICWKLIRAFSAFSGSYDFLETEKPNLANPRLYIEAERSLSLLKIDP